MYDWLVVGAGFAGSVLAERLARIRGDSVLVIDRRPHIGGNAHDRYDAAGVLIHAYGPHIFHTNSRAVLDYLSQFTAWRPYEHHTLAAIGGRLLPIPINRNTLNQLFGAGLSSDEEAAEFLARRAEPIGEIRTSEDVVLATVGRELYEMFFRGYTSKQWGLDPADLDKSVTARVPTRTNTDDRYFTDTFQVMPADGYTAMFARMLDHPRIEIRLGMALSDLPPDVAWRRMIFTGRIDEFFDFRFGRLPYRSLRFEHRTMGYEWHQPVGIVNYPGEEPYTRVTEHKHLTGQPHPSTSITIEYPSATGDPYYPVPRPQNAELYKRYETLGRAQTGTHFVGRLATYRYYNMDQVVGQALAEFRRIEAAIPRTAR